jgi:hypothetical protein
LNAQENPKLVFVSHDGLYNNYLKLMKSARSQGLEHLVVHHVIVSLRTAILKSNVFILFEEAHLNKEWDKAMEDEYDSLK